MGNTALPAVAGRLSVWSRGPLHPCWAPPGSGPPPQVLLLPSVLGGPSTASASGRHSCSPRVGQIQPVTDQPARAAPCIPHCYTFSLIRVQLRDIQLMSTPLGAGCALPVLLSERTSALSECMNPTHPVLCSGSYRPGPDPRAGL